MLALPVFSFFVSPLAAQLSRTHEFQADAYACAQASGADLASALLKLHEDNAATLTPDPVYVRFYYSHPPASERLAALALRSRHDGRTRGQRSRRGGARPPLHGRSRRRHAPAVPRPRQEERGGGGRPGALAAGRRRRRHRQGGAPPQPAVRQDEWKTKSFAANLDQLLVLVAASRCSASPSWPAR
jgi:hypothetical protein